MAKRLYRSRNNRVIAGVAAGIADYFDIDPTIIRILFAVLALGQGSGVLAYVVGWIIIPEEPLEEKNKKDNIPEASDTHTKIAPVDDSKSGDESPRYFLGAVFIVLGAILIIQNLFGFHFWRTLVPLILVVIGLTIITRSLGSTRS